MIAYVEILNFCGIETLKVNLKKFNVFQCDANGAGKSSVLEAIRFAIFGSDDDSIIRTGSNTCEVVLHSDTGSRIERRLTLGGKSKLFVYAPNDTQVPEPQTHLDKFYHPFLFSPTALLGMKSKEIGEFFTNAMSKRLTFSEEDLTKYRIKDLKLGEDPVKAINDYYDTLYKERTGVNRDIKEYETKAKGSVVPGACPEKVAALKADLEVKEGQLKSLRELNAKAEYAQKNMQLRVQAEANVKALEAEIAGITSVQTSVDEITQQLKTLDAAQHALDKALDAERSQYVSLKKALDSLGSGEVVCPYSTLIKCETNMQKYKDGMTASMEAIKVEGAAKQAESEKLKAQIATLRTALDSSNKLTTKNLELERAKALVSQIGTSEEATVQPTAGLEAEVRTLRDAIAQQELSLQVSKVSGIEDKKERQKWLNETLDLLNELLKVTIPSRLTLSVKDVEITPERGLCYQGRPFARLGDSGKLRICTAILKDLFPKGNIFTLDKFECIASEPARVYIQRCVGGEDAIQYFAAYVGDLGEFTCPGLLKVTMDKFKVIKED